MKNRTKRQKGFLFSALPGLALLTVWPLLVHMDTVQTGLEQEAWYLNLSTADDFFMHVRSVGLLLLAVWMVLVLADRMLLQRKRHFSLKLLWPLLAYGGLVMVSTALSVNTSFSLQGAAEQYETLPVILAYLVVFYYFYEMSFEKITDLWMAGALTGAAVQGLIGLSQMAGYDFWQSGFGKWLITLGRGQSAGISYVFSEAGSRQAYLSFYHPNYAAVYLILMIPLAGAAAYCWKKTWQRVAALTVAVLLVICLFGTESRAGFITLVLEAAAGIAVVLSGRKKKLLAAGGLVIAGGIGIAVSVGLTGSSVITRIAESVFPEKQTCLLEGVEVGTEEIRVAYDGSVYCLQLEQDESGSWFSVTDEQGVEYPLEFDAETEEFTLLLKNPEAGTVVMQQEAEAGTSALQQDSETKESVLQQDLEAGASTIQQEPDRLTFMVYVTVEETGIVMNCEGIPWTFYKEPGDTAYQYRTLYGKPDIPVTAEVAFGAGYEAAFSERVYLWSRTVPLLQKYGLTGSGPNTFTLVFPQNDYVMRANMGLAMLMQIISRPHSMYLQSALQTGIPSLIVFLIFFITYIYRAWFLKRKPPEEELQKKAEGGGKDVWGKAVSISVAGFLIMGLANDSLVVVSPVFWALAGIGMTVNAMASNCNSGI